MKCLQINKLTVSYSWDPLTYWLKALFKLLGVLGVHLHCG